MGEIETPSAVAARAAQLRTHHYRGHVVQFYRGDGPLLHEPSRFIGSALGSGDAAIVIATETHREGLAWRLKARGVDLLTVRRQGRYVPLDATEMMSKLTVNGWPDEARFADIIGGLLTMTITAAAGKNACIVVFAEIVALLWATGQSEAVIRLEQLWNGLARSFDFSLVCAYPMLGFQRTGDTGPFLRICAEHSVAVPTENYTILTTEDERLRNIARLQREAQVLEKLAKAHEKLWQSEERFRLLVQHVKDYAIFMLDPQGHVLSWNLGAERIKGYQAEEIIGKHFSWFYSLEDVRAGKPDRELKIAVAEGRVEDEGWRIRKDGSRFWANVVITALRDDQGNLRGFAKVTRDITERKQAEDALRELSGCLLRVQDEERRRLARELHDSTAQTLSALSLNLALVKQRAVLAMDAKASEALAESIELAGRATDELRNISYLLHPPMLDETGLPNALRWFADGFARRTGIRVDLEVPSEFDRLPKDVETALFRVAQESLTNVYRHSGSSTAAVRLALDSGWVTLEARDKGKGLPGEALDKRTGAPITLGVGIRGMRERLHQLGGRLEIESGKIGTRVIAVAPILSSTSHPHGDATMQGQAR
jgi:PAS domain S-box-containing protein